MKAALHALQHLVTWPTLPVQGPLLLFLCPPPAHQSDWPPRSLPDTPCLPSPLNFTLCVTLLRVTNLVGIHLLPPSPQDLARAFLARRVPSPALAREQPSVNADCCRYGAAGDR